MENKILVSLIIPLYNVEKYIPRCLDSIYRQGVNEKIFEIIAVDDGSKDKSSDVVKKYGAIHSNLKLIVKVNGGVSSARNCAIKDCKGEYLIFVDPDDILEDGALKSFVNLVQHIEKSNVIVMRSYISDKEEVYRWSNLFKNHSIQDALFLINKGYVRGSVCGCAFLRKFVILNKLEFPLGVSNSEDTIFFFQCLAVSKVVRFENLPFYKVIGREGSASKIYSVARLDSVNLSLQYVESLVKSYENNSKCCSILNFLKYVIITNFVSALVNTPDVGFAYFKSKDNVRGVFNVNSHGIYYKRLNIYILNFSLRLFYYLIKFKR